MRLFLDSKLWPFRSPFTCTWFPQDNLPRRFQRFRICLSAHQRRRPAKSWFRFLLSIYTIIAILLNVVTIRVVVLLLHASRLIILLCLHAQARTFHGNRRALIVGFGRREHGQRNFLQGATHIAFFMLTVGGCAVGALGGQERGFAEVSACSGGKALVVTSHSW